MGGLHFNLVHHTNKIKEKNQATSTSTDAGKASDKIKHHDKNSQQRGTENFLNLLCAKLIANIWKKAMTSTFSM